MKISRERLTLVGSDANSVYGDSCSINGDASLNALIRAIGIKYGTFNEAKPGGSIYKARCREKRDIEEVFTAPYYDQFSVVIVECVGCFDDSYTAGEGWISEFEINGKAFPVNRYLSQFVKSRIFANNEIKRIVALVDRHANHIWVQAFESVLCRLMPWYFPPELPDEDKEFFRAIAVDNKEVSAEEAENIFVDYVNKIAEKIDFRQLKLGKMLHGIADKHRTRKMTVLQNEIRSIRNDIRSYTDTLTDRYRRLDDKVMQLHGLELLTPSEDDGMKNFFLTHKQVDLLHVYDDYLEFAVNDTLEFYDEEEFERLIGKKSSYVNGYGKEMVELLKAIFLDKIGVIKTHAVFYLDDFKFVKSQSNTCIEEECMPNPHIYFYGCDGANGQYYRQYAESGDWDLGIEQAISATKNLNWGDSTVCSRMIDWLKEREDKRCIYFNDGEPIERVTSDTKLITIREFKDFILNKKAEESNG